MNRVKTESNTVTRMRADGRRSLLVYLDQEVIKQLKRAALDLEKPAYEIVEEAVRNWIAAYKMNQKRKVG